MEGQVAIVTGGAMGIGKEYTSLLLSRKLKVCIADINKAKGLETVSELQQLHIGCDVMFEQCDVSNNEQLENIFKSTIKRFGQLDVLINNAGILNESQEAMTIAINLCAPIRGTMIALGHMSKTSGGQGGVIINISSITGLEPGLASPLYAASKHGVVGFTRAIGHTSIPMHSVRINCICPSYTKTDRTDSYTPQQIYGPDDKMEVVRRFLAKQMRLSPKTVATCLNPILDDVTLSGVTMLCSIEHPQAVLKLPNNLADIHSMYVQK